MTTSRLPGLIDYLIAAFTAAPTLGQATPPVLVLDGPAVTAAPAQLVLYVGLSDAFPPPGTVPTSADSQQTRVGLGAKREEVAAVHCSAVAWSGADDLGTVRRSAFAIVAAVEDLVRLNTDKFGGNGDLAEPGVSGITLQQDTVAPGPTAQVMFSITFKCFVGS